MTLAAGSETGAISLAAANRDHNRYRDAESFDITRSDSSHLAFGHGIHHCLGARLGRLEGLIAFTTLLGRFPAMRLAVQPSALRWGRGDGLVLRGLTHPTCGDSAEADRSVGPTVS